MFRARRGRDEHAYLVEPLEIVEVEIGLLDHVGEGRGELGALGGRQVECPQNERKARTKVHPVMDNGGVLRTRHRTPCSILLKRAQECNQRGPIRWCKGEEAVACHLRLAVVCGDCRIQGRRATVVEIGRALGDAPQWSGAELAARRVALLDAVAE